MQKLAARVNYELNIRNAFYHARCITPRTVALTYDDNPFESVYDLLALLKSYNATATFFPNAPYHFSVWKLDKYIAAAYAAGHQIGLHTWDHVHMNDVEPQKVLDNLEKMNSWIYKVIGVRSTFVRPPYGECADGCRKNLISNGYTVVRWALNTEDWRYQKEDNVQSSIDIINSWESSQVYIDDDRYAGPIVLMHGRLDTTIKVIAPHLLEYFSSKNFRFVSVAECLGFT
ncbi:hypothetical protein BFJ63_vAg19152 [Fusarium oxysporum f. sp. narcissi]|uniref:NodB homology domain-containing protein n=1 Tax=Fusarium oxysporum f. sp. narcissi TaxID=451672 RepID=A0A4V1RXG0_FUSOX|nr:hypothetical protein BFJ63_vAg19152 [Fusarium oxysporum f. sp. narcissi]